MKQKGKLILEDGTTFNGEFFGSQKNISGEVVFNTGMVGYPESLTDPSYSGQILTFTYPLIGNYGIPDKAKENGILKNFESDKIHIKGLIVSSFSEFPNHYSFEKTLDEWLKEEDIPALCGIPTRSLTKILREKGTMLGKILIDNEDCEFYNPDTENLVKNVSCTEIKELGKIDSDIKIILIDCGVKNNIIRCLIDRKIKLTIVPWNYDFTNLEYDGVVISNGPGNPKMCKETVEIIKKVISNNKPILGICLGNQILALAAGMNTYKLKYGHRSQNQPCIEKENNRCFITSQNHGFAVKPDLKDEWEEWFINANDGTNEGIRHKRKPFMSLQFHPEGTPGPKDTEYIFDEFLKIVRLQGSLGI
jgi:carbamoyl-phosphate synthase small subunit